MLCSLGEEIAGWFIDSLNIVEGTRMKLFQFVMQATLILMLRCNNH